MLLQQAITRQRYDTNIRFQDPVVRLRGRDAYIANVQLLNMLFAIDFKVLSLKTSEPDHIDVRCALTTLQPCMIRHGEIVRSHSQCSLDTECSV